MARIELDEGEKNKIDAEIEAIADDEDVGEKEKQKGRWWTEQHGLSFHVMPDGQALNTPLLRLTR